MSIAITLVKNSSQSDRKLIKVVPSNWDDLLKKLDKAARDKLRIKRPTFYYDGLPLAESDLGDLPRALMILVCNGAEKPTGAIGRPQQEATVDIQIADGADDNVHQEIEATAQLPGMIQCQWYAPGVAVYRSKKPHQHLVPDPGWGITVFKLELEPADLERKADKFQRRYKRIKWGKQSWGWTGESAPWMSKWEGLYGTLGNGTCQLWTSSTAVYLVINAGSMDLGADIKKRYANNLEQYMQWQAVAVQWARANRATIAEVVCGSLHIDRHQMVQDWVLQQTTTGDSYTHLINVLEDGTPVPDPDALLQKIDAMQLYNLLGDTPGAS